MLQADSLEAGFVDFQEAHFAVFCFRCVAMRPSELACRQKRMSRQAVNYLLSRSLKNWVTRQAARSRSAAIVDLNI